MHYQDHLTAQVLVEVHLPLVVVRRHSVGDQAEVHPVILPPLVEEGITSLVLKVPQTLTPVLTSTPKTSKEVATDHHPVLAHSHPVVDHHPRHISEEEEVDLLADLDLAHLAEVEVEVADHPHFHPKVHPLLHPHLIKAAVAVVVPVPAPDLEADLTPHSPTLALTVRKKIGPRVPDSRVLVPSLMVVTKNTTHHHLVAVETDLEAHHRPHLLPLHSVDLIQMTTTVQNPSHNPPVHLMAHLLPAHHPDSHPADHHPEVNLKVLKILPHSLPPPQEEVHHLPPTTQNNIKKLPEELEIRK